MVEDEFYKKEIINYYSWLETIINNSNSFGYTDINISLESFIVRLFKILDLGDYTNCNEKCISYPTIDLFNEKLKIGIQVTNECTAEKINKTLSNKKDYKIKFFFLNSNYKPRKSTINKYKNLCEDDILNFKKCLVFAENRNKLKDLYDFFADNIVLPINTKTLVIKDGYSIYEQDFFMEKMKEICDRFVPTSITCKCLSHLEHNNILILTGNPGVGKTYNSYFLTAKMMEKGYILLHSPNNKLTDIFKKYNEKENFVLFIDDVFGSNETNFMTSLGEEELVSLLSSRKSNLKIIINSRCSIFEDVNNKFDKVERLKLDPFVIEVSDFTCLEKARILVRHLQYNNIPSNMIKQLFEDDKYSFNDYPNKQKIFEILFHKNYNPRAIEMATSNIMGNVNDFVKYILNVLNNPFEIYKHSYNSNLDNVDREILKIIYLKSGSYFGNFISVDAIYKFCSKLGMSTDSVTLSLQKLEKSFIRQYRGKEGKCFCKFYNPGILDFCLKMFENSYDIGKYVDLIDEANDLRVIIKNKRIDDSKKISKIMELNYNNYDDIINISSSKIIENKDFIDYLMDGIFERSQVFYSSMDYFCGDDFLDDSILVEKLENSKNVGKYILFNKGNPEYKILERILKIADKLPESKKNDIFNSIAHGLRDEVISFLEDYIYQTCDEEECEESLLEQKYNEIESEICIQFREYIIDNDIKISLEEIDYIFGLMGKFYYSDYENLIESHFQNDYEEKKLSDDENETILFLKEYSETL